MIAPAVGISKLRLVFAAVLGLMALVGKAAPTKSSAPQKQGADLLKTDIMAVFAHPDDETGVAATLAYYALGRRAVVANVYCTRGEGGGNMVGTHWGPALATLREAELRDCLSTLGVRYCYFLDQLDWAYTESVTATLRKWGKEETLGRLVRLVRALRPEVIVTMNPAPTPGQHGHHQAAGVLATEAFTAAADPNRFPLQLTKEGLTVWQPRKLYYGGGSTGFVAAINISEPLGDGKTPGQVAAQALVNHRSQAFGNFGNSTRMQRPQKFTLVKSFVPVNEPENDLLGGIPAGALKELQLAKRVPTVPIELRFVPRSAISNYRNWVRQQRIEHVAAQFTGDLPVVSGEGNAITLELLNRTGSPVEGELRVSVASGWRSEPLQERLRVSATQQSRILVTVPANARADEEITAQFSTAGETFIGRTKLHPLPKTSVARVSKEPALDDSDSGWEQVPAVFIFPTNLFQGKVTDAADCSAAFRLVHNGKTLFVDVEVKDDVVVTNIAPNDIKGHWRSDSIEICIDPTAGAEDTMGCFKLGIFPFDTAGVVRGARDADANQGPVEETAPNTRLVSRKTADGYRIQAAIPFEEIGVTLTSHTRLGFNLIIYDGDKRDAALGENINKSRIAWAPRAGVMGRPEDWGRIDLE